MTRMSEGRILAAAFFLAGAASPVAQAVCSTTAQSVPFGNYSPLDATALDSTGQVSVTCSGLSILVSYTIKLSAGGSGSYVNRQMALGAGRLNYNLYTNVLRATIWGDGTGGSLPVTDGYLLNLGGTTRNYTVYGRILPLQNISAGMYSDTILVTVEY